MDEPEDWGHDDCSVCEEARKPIGVTREDVEALRYAAYMLVEVSREAADEKEWTKLHAASDRLIALAVAFESRLPPA
jgi:hypothetical protein